MKLLLAVSLYLAACAFSPMSVATTNTSKATGTTKDEYAEIVQHKIDTWEQLIQNVRKGTYSDKTFQRKVSESEARRLAGELETTKDAVSRELNNLKSASGDEWKTWRARIQSRLASLRKEFKGTVAE